MAKNDNMLAILWMLHSGSKITAKQISENLEINIRTVYRYIDSLCASGVPIISDAGHNGGYSLINDFIKTPLLFDIEEKKALLCASVFAKEAGHPLSKSLDSATAKLLTYSTNKQENILNHNLNGFEVINNNGNYIANEILEHLEKAVDSGSSVEISYITGREEKPKNRIIDPYGMVYWNNRWYVVAFCHLRNEIRSFRLERILLINETKNMFNRPKEFSARDFFIKNLLPNLEGMENIVSLVIEGKAETLDDLCIHWFLGHYLKERSLDKVTFMLDEKLILAYVPYFLLSYGKSIKILEPKSLREKLFNVAQDLMEYYKI